MMGLASVTDAFASYLQGALSPAPKLVGTTYPSAATDLPAVVVSVSNVTQQLRGVGKLPVASLTGALPVTTTVDLSNPVATFPDAVVPLLSNDRITLTLPHGPLVTADGATTAFTGTDLQATLGATTFAVVSGAPAAGQVQPDPALGALHFGTALPAGGTLVVSYFIGEWEVRTERHQGTLLVEAFAPDAAGVDTLSRDVETALLAPAGAPLAGLGRIEPMSWQAIEESGTNRGQARSRALAFAIDYELVEPDIGTGGGLISTVSVTSTFGAEHFDVQREGSSA
jgi:hypothetical protein